MNLPKDFEQKMRDLLGSQADDFFKSLDNPSQKAITVNFERLKKDVFEKNCDFEIESIPLTQNGYFASIPKFSQNVFNHMGVIYSQEPSAMYPVELMDIRPQDICLDVCASPGGKSIQILEKLGGSGLLVSNEIAFSRAKILRENLTRMGFDNFIITCNSSEELARSNILFDKILVDAPCGGEGMIRKNNFDMNFYSPTSIDSNAERQLKILENVSQLLKSNGTLVYSTCTYDIRENENVIFNFIKKHSDFEIIHKPEFLAVCDSGIKIEDVSTNYALRRYPHRFKGEGQFMITLKQVDCESLPQPKPSLPKCYCELNQKELMTILSTLKGVINIKLDSLVKINDEIYVLPKCKLNLKNLNVIYLGVHVGTLQKNVFKIAHECYHTYGKYFEKKIELNELDVYKYLHGEELSFDRPNGIYAVEFLGVTLGGGKMTNGKLKNYYPKELRI